MLLGTVMGVLVIPGLYYLFARIADGRKLLRVEVDEPLSEIFEHGQLPPDDSAENGEVPTGTTETAPAEASSGGHVGGHTGTTESAPPES
jgi:HAE1 family hydrophobic/amphiphilic exporter-1